MQMNPWSNLGNAVLSFQDHGLGHTEFRDFDGPLVVPDEDDQEKECCHGTVQSDLLYPSLWVSLARSPSALPVLVVLRNFTGPCALVFVCLVGCVVFLLVLVCFFFEMVL